MYFWLNDSYVACLNVEIAKDGDGCNRNHSNIKTQNRVNSLRLNSYAVNKEEANNIWGRCVILFFWISNAYPYSHLLRQILNKDGDH